MSKEKRRVPKLRFPGFTEDWEQRKLGEIFEYLQNNTLSRDSLNYKNPNIKNIHYGDILVKFDEILDGSNKDIPYINSELDLSKFSKSLLQDGDIIFSDTAEDDTVGKAIELQNVNAPFILSGLHTIPCRPLIPFGKGYLGNFLNSYSYRIQLRPLIQGIKVSSISKSALKDTMIEYPKNLDEQEKIGSLFQNVAKMITLHQRKLDNLKLKKKALLQKIFPKNGERYPELRFPGFTDTWEQRKLTDIAKTFIGLVTTMTENYRDSGTLLIRNSDIKEGQFIFSEKPIHLDEEFAEKNKTRRLQIGDVVTVHTGDIGTSAVIQEKEAGAIGFATINTRTDKRILNPYFLSTYFNTEKHKCYANSVSTGDGRSNYNIKDFNKLVISIPTLDEQEKISVLINNINTIITLHQRKLDHLKLQKKALLQQLFV